MMAEREASAQMLSEAEPESAGMSTVRLGRLPDFLSQEADVGSIARGNSLRVPPSIEESEKGAKICKLTPSLTTGAHARD